MKYVEKSGNNTHSVSYTYDDINNLTALVETVGNQEYTTSYSYDGDNRLTSLESDNVFQSYTYDAYGRVTQKTAKNGDQTVIDEAITYRNAGPGGITAQPFQLIYTGTNYSTTFGYGYNTNDNIVYVNQDGNTTYYYYDSANQLIREDNSTTDTTTLWTYDAAGNILRREVYPFSGAVPDPDAKISQVEYTYGDSDWGDLLTEYNGVEITYDGIGNPVNDGTWTYTWQHGRQLASMAKIDQSETWQFTYNADGLRTQRTNGTTTYKYTYLGGQLTHMTVDGHTMYFAYDASGVPLAMTYDGVDYYYVTNIQGDVVSILNASGTEVVSYAYDAWGNLISTTGDMADTLGFYNPLRYRGYVYDAETELYYLQSRYYNPEMGRFINADDFVSTGHGILGNNMFAYCMNNPVMRIDPTGYRYTKYADSCGNYCPHEEKDFLETFLTRMARNRQDGNTFSAGFSGACTFGDLTIGGSGVLSADTSNNYAFQATTSTGVAPGIGASGGLTMTYTNATDVQDLTGASVSYGGSLVALAGISADYITFTPKSNPNTTCWGISITISLGGEIEVRAAENYTTSTKSWNLWLALRKALYGG